MGDEQVVVIQRELVLMIGNSAQVIRDLPVILADILQALQFKGPYRQRTENDIPQRRRQPRVAYRELSPGHDAVVRAARLPQQPAEVLYIQGAAQAFAVKHRVVFNIFRHAPVGEDVREIKLPARLKHAEDLSEHLALIRRQVYYAV